MTAKVHEFIISGELAEQRLDKTLAALLPDSSRTYLQSLIKNGKVLLNGTPVSVPRTSIREGATLSVIFPEQIAAELSPEPFQFDILYEDEHILVIDKPAGVVVHPAVGNPDGTVVNALLSRYPGIEKLFPNAERPGIVHRLDKDTSGCLAIAKTPDALFKLGQAFSDRQTAKTYLAICRGVPQKLCGELKTLIGRHPGNRQKMAIVDRNGKEAHTAYKVKAHKMIDGVPLTLVEVQIFTGRTHQIRVHMASLGLPIIGDTVYGNRNTTFPGVQRQLLHAWRLALPHPATGEMQHFTAPEPDDFLQIKALIKS
ncbi:MAG: RluA family pseudouridine synthase [Lentisphaeria bacterium]|nr:RluA family pseudouridine synthase [Lentisphaeria bacterium]